MRITRSIWLAALALGLAASASGEITSIAATAEASAREIINGEPGDETRVFKSFPGTAGELPLQVFARLRPASEIGAAAVAGQFADPTTLNQPNPEEFAINFSLASRSGIGFFEGDSTLIETRGVRFSAADLNNPTDGQARVRGRLFLNGALALFAETEGQSLEGASVRLAVSVDRIGPDGASVRVFDGSVELLGTASGVDVQAAGTFPTGTLVLSNLSRFVAELPTFRALIVPALQIDYEYDATVDEEFTLRATVRMEGRTVEAEGGVGVAGLLGAPTDALIDVLAVTRGIDGAAKMIQALETERAEPTGAAAFPFSDGPRLGTLCGLFGLEMWLGVAGLTALRFGRGRRG